MSKQSGKTEAEGQGGGGTRWKVRPPASLEGACPVGIWLLPGGSPDGPPAGLRVRRQRPARLRWPAQPVFSVQPALDQGNFAGEGLVCFLFLKSSKTLLILATNIKITKEPQSTPSHPLNVRPHRTRVGSPISSAWSQRKVGAALGQVGAMVLAWTVVAGPQERRRAAAWGSSGQRGAPSPAFSVPASSARALCLGPGARGPWPAGPRTELREGPRARWSERGVGPGTGQGVSAEVAPVRCPDKRAQGASWAWGATAMRRSPPVARQCEVGEGGDRTISESRPRP